MKKRVVICEDDESIREVMLYVLGEKYDVITLSDCGDIGELIQHRPKLVLMDLLMPTVDGPSLVKKLKVNDKTKKIPVVIVSANSDIEEVAKEVGADGILKKPFDIEDLEETVSKYTQ